jgi:SP family xylose:H+ symportor-like MFS transporter
MTTSASESTPAGPAESRGLIYLGLICFVATLGGLLFGYDTAVIAGAIGLLEKHFALGAGAAEGWTAACALAGCALGAAGAGALCDRLGRKKTLLVSAILFVISSIGTAVPESLTVFVIFRFLGGIGIGAASMTSPMYIAEVSPARLRGRMVSLNQFAIVTGMLLVGLVNYLIARAGTDAWNEAYGWRWMFGSGTIPAVLFFFLLLPVPESPRWLTEKGRRQEARTILARVNGRAQAEQELASIEAAIALETGSLRELFQPGLRTVLVIGVALAVLQQVTGINVFLYFAPQIFRRIAGDGMEAALLQTVVVNAVNMLFTIIAIWTVDRLGRRPLMLIGFCGMGVALLALSIAAYTQQTGVWTLIFMLGYIACFALSVGPVTWVLLSEIFPNRIRGRAMAIATVCLWLANLVVTQTFPMMDKNEWLLGKFHHAFPFWVYGVLCVVALLFVRRFVPETKGRTLEEIEKSWL